MEPDDIAANVAAVRTRIAAACDRAGRDPASVSLIAVTKTHPAQAIAAAYDAGLRDFGENKIQEAQSKVRGLREPSPDATWHLIGHLQRNKVRPAVDLFDVLHSVDSLKLARAISERVSAPIRVYLEVNVGGEESKHGVAPALATAVAEQFTSLPNITLVGLMTVAPAADAPEEVRPIFRRLRELRDAIGLPGLSMGMTGDFEVAIEEGATAVRVGRAIFGPRV